MSDSQTISWRNQVSMELLTYVELVNIYHMRHIVEYDKKVRNPQRLEPLESWVGVPPPTRGGSLPVRTLGLIGVLQGRCAPEEPGRRCVGRPPEHYSTRQAAPCKFRFHYFNSDESLPISFCPFLPPILWHVWEFRIVRALISSPVLRNRRRNRDPGC